MHGSFPAGSGWPAQEDVPGHGLRTCWPAELSVRVCTLTKGESRITWSVFLLIKGFWVLTIIKNMQLLKSYTYWKVWLVRICFSLAPAYGGRMSIKTSGTAVFGEKGQLEWIKDL